ncbi:MAG: hypothetical protein M3Q97_06530, partial [Bacteroidota bacterium]|nr:hypothetical protein [Bacteroidota bacterium]
MVSIRYIIIFLCLPMAVHAQEFRQTLLCGELYNIYPKIITPVEMSYRDSGKHIMYLPAMEFGFYPDLEDSLPDGQWIIYHLGYAKIAGKIAYKNNR